jgi:thiol-disulfide isomerase/thioredoxin
MMIFQGRRWLVGFVVVILLLVLSSGQQDKSETTSLKLGRSKIRDIQAVNITSTIADWESDVAVMFYAPWCKYCKQLIPSWEAIAGLVQDKGDLSIARLNCEGEKDNVKLCASLGIDRYPTIMFFGYGNYNQAPKGNPFGKPRYPQMVQYVADLYPEAIYEWILFLSSVSTAKRRWSDFFGIFTGKSRTKRKLELLEKRVRDAERKADLFGKELERYKAYELFDSLEDHGDIFPLLHDLNPDEINLPLRVCVADMAAEYCQYNESEPYCLMLNRCIEQDMIPESCRPSLCPFTDKRGCVVVSTCMKPDVVKQYKQSLKIDV